MPNPDDPFKELAETMKELAELQQQIDDSARKIVKSVRTLVDHRTEYRPVQAADYPAYDAAYYDGTERDLAGEGIASLGDFDDATFSRNHPDKDVFVRLGLAADATTGAIWFRLGTASSLALQSWLEDGRTIITVRSSAESAVPNRPEVALERVTPQTGVRDVVRRHRSRVAAAGALPRLLRGLEDLVAAYAADERASAAFRDGQGLALFEPMLRKKLGDNYEDEGAPLVESILAHPEWWTGEAPKSVAPAGGGPISLMFLASREHDGRGHFTTAGLALHGLPDLQMKAVAANHCRAARFLMSVVARKLVRDVAERPLPAHLELELTRADVALPAEFVSLGRYPEVEVQSEGPARVRLVLEGFNLGSEPDLLHVLPPGDRSASKDEWLRDTCRRLGQDAPPPLSLDAFDAQMEAASRKGRETLSEVRDRFRRGLPADQTLLIKVALPSALGGREFVWVKANDWTGDGVLIGTLESAPHNLPGLERGHEMRVVEADVFDRAVVDKEQGMLDAALTDIVAQEFGVDL